MSILLGVTADELRAINKSFGGTKQMNSTIESVFQSAEYVGSFWDKVAMVVRSIAGGLSISVQIPVSARS